MPRPRRPWFRFYVEAIHDRKLRRLPPAQRWVWVTVLAVARQAPVAGYLLLTSDGDRCEPLAPEDIADAAAVRVKDAREALSAFEDLGMVERDDDLGALRVAKWSERQYESDDVTERTRKHRSRERSNELDGNVPTSSPGTPPSRAPARTRVTENREQITETPPAPPPDPEPATDPQPPDPGGNSNHNPEPVLDALEAGMPPDLSPGWRQDRAIAHARRAITQRLAVGWQPRELADAIAQPGWRGVNRPAGVIASRATALAETTAPSVVHARRMQAEHDADARRQDETADTERRRAELDDALEALDDDERQELAEKAADALPVPREPDLAIPGVRAMARSILAEREDTP